MMDKIMNVGIGLEIVIGVVLILLGFVCGWIHCASSKHATVRDLYNRIRILQKSPPVTKTIYIVEPEGKITVKDNAQIEIRHGQEVVHYINLEGKPVTACIDYKIHDCGLIRLTRYTDFNLAVRQSIVNGYRFMIRYVKLHKEYAEKIDRLEKTMQENCAGFGDDIDYVEIMTECLEHAKMIEGWPDDMDLAILNSKDNADNADNASGY